MTSAFFEAPPTTRVQDGGLTAIVVAEGHGPRIVMPGGPPSSPRSREAIGGE